MKFKKSFVVVMLILAMALFYFKRNEKNSEQFKLVESYVNESADLIQEVGQIEGIELVSFKKGYTGEKTNIMYRINVEGSEKDITLFIYLSNKNGVWKILKSGKNP